MRMAHPWSLAACTTSRTRSALPMLPGLIRRQAAPAGRLEGALVMEMDVGDQRHPCRADDLFEGGGGLGVGTGHPHNVGAGIGGGMDLVERRADIGGDRVGHGLHGNWRLAADGDPTHMNLTGAATGDVTPGTYAHGTLSQLAAVAGAADNARLASVIQDLAAARKPLSHGPPAISYRRWPPPNDPRPRSHLPGFDRRPPRRRRGRRRRRPPRCRRRRSTIISRDDRGW